MTACRGRPTEETLSVTRAARVLGVHPNTIRSWSDAGRLRFFRINRRGDRRYRLVDLERFMAAGRRGSLVARAQRFEATSSGLVPGAASTPSAPSAAPRSPAPRSPVPHAAASHAAASRAATPRAPVPRAATSHPATPRSPVPRAATPRAWAPDARVETWAAQLRSIQGLGARLNRLTNIEEIAGAIVTELGLLLGYDNIRVYAERDGALLPVAVDTRVREFFPETFDQLKVALGEGITGWVAQHKVAQLLPDCAADPRTRTIPGNADNLEESMILAPMVFDDVNLGVLVLSKLGLAQFTDDDLRLLEIYASFAAQAFSNAEINEQLRAKSAALEHQLRSQHELLSITESILTTLDPQRVLDQVADRLGELVGYENLVIEVVDPTSGELHPLTARGPHAVWLLKPADGGEAGIASWVREHRQAVLILDERDDPRLGHVTTEHQDGSLIAVPLRGRNGPSGVLILERLGPGTRYSEAEFELVQLFAAQVSIALQNAEAHRALEIRAASDDLTGLLNHGTFQRRLSAEIVAGGPFSLIMLDLDFFKTVNDELGHQAGDGLLAEIARAIEAASRETDGVFRYGGDEFTMILPGADDQAALVVANRVLATISALGGPASRWHRRGVSISASLGVATFPDSGSSAADILLAADRACQVSKRTGRARISTAADGLALAAEFTLKEPTPVDRHPADGG